MAGWPNFGKLSARSAPDRSARAKSNNLIGSGRSGLNCSSFSSRRDACRRRVSIRDSRRPGRGRSAASRAPDPARTPDSLSRPAARDRHGGAAILRARSPARSTRRAGPCSPAAARRPQVAGVLARRLAPAAARLRRRTGAAAAFSFSAGRRRRPAAASRSSARRPAPARAPAVRPRAVRPRPRAARAWRPPAAGRCEGRHRLRSHAVQLHAAPDLHTQQERHDQHARRASMKRKTSCLPES